MSQTEIITLIIAFYGALLSTVIAIRDFSKDKRRVKVVCKFALADPSDQELWEFVSIDIINTEHRPIKITGAGLLLSDGNQFTQLVSKAGKNPLPKKLEDGESCSVMFDIPKIEQVLKNLKRPNVKFTKAFASDAEGNVYIAFAKIFQG